VYSQHICRWHQTRDPGDALEVRASFQRDLAGRGEWFSKNYRKIHREIGKFLPQEEVILVNNSAGDHLVSEQV